MRIVLAMIAAGALCGPARAQIGFAWLEYQDATAQVLDPSAWSASGTQDEVDFGWGDLDKNGLDDLVVVRKAPFSLPGPRTNLLLLNVGGFLVDVTSVHATASDVPGDQGFLTPTYDRDVAIVDVDLDGWLDVVTATALGGVLPKHLGHPRVYRNLGNDASGAWQGLRFEHVRSPTILTAAGQPTHPRFVSVAAGDVNGDGLPDLYFGDYDSSPGGGPSELAQDDVGDRLWINAGNGYFHDHSDFATFGSVDAATTNSFFAYGATIADLNADGLNDLLHGRAVLQGGTHHDAEVVANYNGEGGGAGKFGPPVVAHSKFTTYAFASGDLNKDGRIDFVAPDDFADRYRFHTGLDALQRVVWSPPKTFQFASANFGDDGFAGQTVCADLNGDGWNDVIIADLDLAAVFTGNRYCHVYRNVGGTPGSFDVKLRHEHETTSPSLSVGWRGVKGMLGDDLKQTYDVAPIDVDGDGDLDLVLGRFAGISVWRNLLDPVCQSDLGQGLPGTIEQSVCGESLASGQTALLRLQGAPGAVPVFLAVAMTQQPTFVPELGVSLVPFPLVFLLPAQTAPDGTLLLEIPGGGGPFSVYTQWIVQHPATPSGWGLSNALKFDFLP